MSTHVGKMRVLFLCTGNSCRSQMAEGWARHLKGDLIDAYSAGVEPQKLSASPVAHLERSDRWVVLSINSHARATDTIIGCNA